MQSNTGVCTVLIVHMDNHYVLASQPGIDSWSAFDSEIPPTTHIAKLLACFAPDKIQLPTLLNRLLYHAHNKQHTVFSYLRVAKRPKSYFLLEFPLQTPPLPPWLFDTLLHLYFLSQLYISAPSGSTVKSHESPFVHHGDNTSQQLTSLLEVPGSRC